MWIRHAKLDSHLAHPDGSCRCSTISAAIHVLYSAVYLLIMVRSQLGVLRVSSHEGLFRRRCASLAR